MLTMFTGTYIAFGPTVEPRVISLTRREHTLFLEGRILCEKYPRQRAYLYGQTFGAGIDEALPVWDEQITTSIGEKYEGPHWQLVRALAAAIVLNIPFQELFEKRRKGGNGGAGDRLPKVPISPKPLGVTA